MNSRDKYESCEFFNDCRKHVLHGAEPEVKFPGFRFWRWVLLEPRETIARFFILITVGMLSATLAILAGYHVGAHVLIPVFFFVLVSMFLVGLRVTVVMAAVLPMLAEYYFIPPIGEFSKSAESLMRFGLFCGFSSVAIYMVYSLSEGFRSVFIAHRVAKAARIEAEIARDDAERARAAKADFLANMSHEIRTPLNGISGLVQLFAKQKLTDKQKEFVESMESVLEQLHTTINNILDFSKLDAGSLTPENIVFDLHKLVDETARIFNPLAHRKGLRFFVKLKNGKTLLFVGDPLRIRQILINLLSNAVKFTGRGKVSLLVDVQVLRSKTLARVGFEVSDTGVGISEEAQKHLFSHFFQAEASTARRFGGTGLGLAISKQLADLMGGKINFKSKLNLGTTFRFELTLPIADVKRASKSGKFPVTRVALPSEELLRTRRHHLILVAEDNELNLQITQAMLVQAGYQVVGVRDGNEVFKEMKGRKFSLILMDLQMPIYDGYHTTARLRAQGLSIPIVALTAHSAPEDRARCVKAGMDDYLSKPFRSEQLVQLVDGWVLGGSPQNNEAVDWSRIQQLNALAIGDQKDLLARLLDLYKNDMERFRKEFSDRINSPDHSILLNRIHSFKSASANLGLKNVVAVLEQMEGSDFSTNKLSALEDKLNSELDRGLQELEAVRESPSNGLQNVETT